MANETLSGLPLRKALCEALGWRLFNYESGMYATSTADIDKAWSNDGYTLEGWSESREAWEFTPESDPGVFWPVFEKWADAGPHEWRVSRNRHRLGYSVTIWLSNQSPAIFADGSTLLEAACRAWLAALEQLR